MHRSKAVKSRVLPGDDNAFLGRLSLQTLLLFNNILYGGKDMPGGDRRGPSGFGPMTGRGMGFCSGYDRPGFANNYSGRGFARRGFGGAGFGGAGFGGRGRGFRNRFFQAAPYPDWDYRGSYELTPEREMDMLRNEAKAIEGELDSIQSRLKELENLSQGNRKD